ncbi:MAG: hypothetical protein ACR2NM_01900 [Bythopirellula sp.]
MKTMLACTFVGCLALTVACQTLSVTAQDVQVGPGSLPTVKFFYYRAKGVEWAFSDDAKRFQQHLVDNSESQLLYDSVSTALNKAPAVKDTADRMTKWIESERDRFQQSRSEVVRIRMAEGITAYMRAHDFDVANLVEALKRRSGATDVELVAIHLRDMQEESSFRLKVVLVDSDVPLGKQGINVSLRSPNVSYSTVGYALAVALYEVHEILNREESGEGNEPAPDIESLPIPEALDGPDLVPTPATFNES